MAPILSVDRVTKYFAGLAALKEVSFELRQGGIYGLIGPNGAGKTTLLTIVAGALRPTAGSVIFQDRRLSGAKSFRAVRAGIVRTHQIPRPFRALSVLANISVGSRFGLHAQRSPSGTHDERRILEWVGLAHLADAPAATLSVGDQKRLELARALAAVLRLLREIQQAGTTILYVEHNLKAIMSVCDHVIVMNYGRKLAEGSPQAMQNDPAVIEAYIGRTAGT